MHKKDVVGGLFVAVGALLALSALSTFFLPPALALLILKLLVASAAVAIGGVLFWIGVQLLTSPPPKGVEEVQKELESEIEKIKEEVKRRLGSTEG